MAEHEENDVTVVAMPGENEAERRRIRRSNDHDQQMERLGKASRHNNGYDDAADGTPGTAIERIVDE